MKLGVVSRVGEFPKEYWGEEFETFGITGKKTSHLELISNYPHLGPLTYTLKDIDIIRDYSSLYGLDLIMHLLPNQRGITQELSKTMFSDLAKSQEFFELERQLNQKFNIGSLDEQVRKSTAQEIIKSLEMARKIRAKLITIHGGSFVNHQEYNKHLTAARCTLKDINPYFTDVKLCIENLPTIGHGNNLIMEMPNQAKDLLYLIDDLDNIGICFDTGHANVPGNVLEFYEIIKSTQKIWNMHLHDNNGKADDHLSIGNGNIPFKVLFERLKSDDYKGYCSIELDTWCREVMEKSERIKALEFLRDLLKDR